MPDQVMPEGEEGQGQVPVGDPNAVTLSKEEYNNLIGEMAGLKIKLGSIEEDRRVQIAKAEAEAQAKRAAAGQQPINFDAMSKVDFANFIMHQVNQQMIQPVLELVMTNVVKSEISEVAGKHDDFWLYKDEVYKMTKENPQLSIEKAYKLAKTDDPERGVRAKAKANPPTPKDAPRTFGEKPGVSRGSMSQKISMDVKAAASKAVGDMLKDLPDD